MTCLKCGQCCFPYSLAIDENHDIARWLTYHGVMVRESGQGRMSINGHYRCEMLRFEADGTTACAVYNDRPEICAEYLCHRAQDN